jgi:hypothetical protein
MRRLKDLENTEKGKTFLICGAGSTLSDYTEEILSFVERESPVVVGVNNMTGLLSPDYHVWTNTQRFKDFGHTVQPESTPLFSKKMKNNIIRQHWKGEYVSVEYTDHEGLRISYNKGIINGYYRTAGCLSIMIAHIMGASRIYIVGMDGYTYRNKQDIDDGKTGQHFYGKGMTDGYDWEGCLHKDKLVADVLRSIKKYGVEFSIITPTIFSDFYRGGIL